MTDFLPYCRQSLDSDDFKAVDESIAGAWLTTGKTIDSFEEKFAVKAGAKYAVACANGTAALHIMALASGIGEGDIVIVPSMTFAATANAVRYVGADVIFADVDPYTGLITEKTLSEAIEKADINKLKAVYVVHLAGRVVDMQKIQNLLNEKAPNAIVYEDACHAIGGTYPDKNGDFVPVGSCPFSEASIFSLHPAKTMTTGEGGIVTTNNKAFADKMRLCRSHGITREADDFVNKDMAFAPDGKPNPWYYELQFLGFNYRLTDFQCALGISQLNKLDKFVQKRRELVTLYDEKFKKLAPLVKESAKAGEGERGWHLYTACIDFEKIGIDRGTFMRRLSENKVGTQVHYIPLHQQPYYRDLYGEQTLKGAEEYYAKTLSLPLFYSMTENDVERVVSTIEKVINNA